MKRRMAMLVLLGALHLAAGAAPPPEPAERIERLLKLLQAKGVLSETDAADLLRDGDSNLEARLVVLLERKGVLTAGESAELLGSGPAPAAGQRQAAPPTPKTDPLARPPDFGPGEAGVTARAILPRPVEALPLAQPHPAGALTLRLGSAATISPYGIIKTSLIHDSNLSSGDDFPFFGRVVAAGPETANSTGTLARPADFRVKARFSRLGLDVLAPDPNNRFTVSGKLEFDFEGSFPTSTSRNIGALRASEASIRLAWVRLDTRAGGLPVFLKFGQDASLFASTTQPTGLETSGNYMWQGNANERAPGLVGGARFDLGGAWDARLAPEAGIFLPSGGEYVTEVSASPRWGSGLGSAFANNNPAPGQGTTGFGQREGTNSGRPRYEGRLVLEFEPWRNRRISASQIVASFQFAERVRYFAPPFQTAGRNFPLRSDSNGYTGEFRLATPWWTLLGKYYRGADLRFYFAGLAQEVFFQGGDPFSEATLTPRMRPVRAQGGFAQLQLPLSVWFNPRNPRLHGFSSNLMCGYDSAFARDARRAAQRRAQMALMGNLLYQYNRFVQFGLETDFIQAFYTGEQGGVFDPARGILLGPRGRVGKNLRFEFSTTFTF